MELSDRVQINSSGVTLGEKRAAERLHKAFCKGWGEVAGKPVSENESPPPMLSAAADRYIAPLNLDAFWADFWVENESNLRVNIFPPNHELQFNPTHPERHPELFHPDTELIGNQLCVLMEKFMPSNEFRTRKSSELMGFYPHFENHRRAPMRSSSLYGVDLFDLFFWNCMHVPMWAEGVTSLLITLNDVMLKKRAPLEM